MAKAETTESQWFLVDANNKTLGRLASEIAKRLRGKHKPEFTPHVLCGDSFIVVNVKHLRVTGNKREDKLYHHYSGYPSGLKTFNFDEMMDRSPERILMLAVKGMLPKGPLGRRMLRNLKIYADDQHPHHAQQPKPLEL